MGKVASVPEPDRAKLWVQVDLTLNHVSQLIPDQLTQSFLSSPGEKKGVGFTHRERDVSAEDFLCSKEICCFAQDLSAPMVTFPCPSFSLFCLWALLLSLMPGHPELIATSDYRAAFWECKLPEWTFSSL